MTDFKLRDGARVGVIGGGPAGSFFSFFLLRMAESLGLELSLDLYEPRDYTRPGPAGCNHCGGIISETLVESLALEGINLPDNVVQRGIDSYVLHMDVGPCHIETPLHEQRIAAVLRGAGPRGTTDNPWKSFDGFLLDLACKQGARHVPALVDQITWNQGRPRLRARGGEETDYDFIAVACGVNTSTLKLFNDCGLDYVAPQKTKTYICEYPIGREAIQRFLGTSMHVFLLNIPRLEFGALIPKGDCVTACMLGYELDPPLVAAFLNSMQVRQCMPPELAMQEHPCQCMPFMNVGAAQRPYGDRLVFLGDAGVARLYKDGIGSAYRSAKAAAKTALFHGVAGEDFRRHYRPVCRAIDRDNQIGKLLFLATRQLQRWRFTRRGIARIVAAEQESEGRRRLMSRVLWDVFTGSASYQRILIRSFHPLLVGRFIWHMSLSLLATWREGRRMRVNHERLGQELPRQ